MRVQQILNIIKRSWLSQFWINFATTGVLAMSLAMVFGTALISKNIARLMTVWGDEIQLTIYLQDGITGFQKDALEAKFKSSEAVSNVEYIDKNKAASLFEKSLKNYGPHFLESLKADVGNPFPAAYHIQLKPQFKNPEKVEATAKEFQALDGVEDASYGQEWVKNYTSLVKMVRVLGLVFGVVVFVGCIFTVSNSIRASLSARKEEIEILELVGATSGEVRMPFIIEGAFQGFLSAALAVLFLGILYSYSYGLLENIVGATTLTEVMSFFNILVLSAMILFGVFVGALGSYVCVSKMNTGWAAASGVRKL